MGLAHVLTAGDYALVVEPEEGGAVARFDWKRVPLFRARCGPGPLNSACFPLVPFSNRIAFGRFVVDGQAVEVAPNFPGEHHPHPLHGFGWLQSWKVDEAGEHFLRLRYAHTPDAWPWHFEAEQTFELSAGGLRHQISVRNLSTKPMPTGLGFHPFFPRDKRTMYRGLHQGEWQTSKDGLPLELRREDRARDWWDGAPVAARCVDTVYVDRDGPLLITWPESGVDLVMAPSRALKFTVIYSPADADFFCVEPVSHETDAINRGGGGLHWLRQDDVFAAHVDYAAHQSEQKRGGREI